MMPRYVFTNRHDGDYQKKMMDKVIFSQQVHGNNIAIVTSSGVGQIIPNVDGLVYNKASDDHVALAVRVADCVPILAWDEKVPILGVAHAGWRGTLGNIAGNLIRTMASVGAHPSTIHIAIGPHIGMCCYSVPKERAKTFLDEVHNDNKIAVFMENSWHIDIGWSNLFLLMKAGVNPVNINAPIVCTSCQVDTYFSYRKDTHTSFGEQIGKIWYEN